MTPSNAHVLPSSPTPPSPASSDTAALASLHTAYERITAELGKVIVGQQAVIDELLVALLCRGHALIVGVPGLAKTLIVNSLSQVLALSFKRIQFTPDLMPADVTGTELIEETAQGHREFVFAQGPVFAHLILADEINRTPPKTQAALLEAMQEHHVTVAGQTRPLPAPFFVLATQNPIEQEGTYPLPEAELDRFMFEIRIEYPDIQDELQILKRTTTEYDEPLQPVLSAVEILALQKLVRRIPVPDATYQYALRLVRATRPTDASAPGFIRQWLEWGAGPRAAQYLILGAKAGAALDGHPFARVADVQAVARPVLRHRLIRNFTADSEGITPDAIVDRLVKAIEC